MKLPIQLQLSDSEKKLLKRVIIISLCISAAISVFVLIQNRRPFIKQATPQARKVIKPRATQPGAGVEMPLPIDLEAHESAAQSYKNRLMFDKSIDHLKRALTLQPQNKAGRLELATMLTKGGLFDEAIEQFEILLTPPLPDSLRAQGLPLYGLALFSSGKIRESVSILDEAIEKFPGLASAYSYRAQVEAARNLNSPQVEKLFKKARTIDSTDAETIYQLARYTMQKPGRTDDDLIASRNLLLEALRREPLSSKTYGRLGMIYYLLDEPSGAENAYRTALTLNEYDFNTHYNLAELYFYTFANRPAALNHYKSTIRLKPDHSEALFKIGLIAMDNEMYKEAAGYFQKSLQSAPLNIRVMLQLAVAYEQLAMVDRAIEVYRSILQADNLNAIAMQKLRLLGAEAW